jgi:hypothetical protein
VVGFTTGSRGKVPGKTCEERIIIKINIQTGALPTGYIHTKLVKWLIHNVKIKSENGKLCKCRGLNGIRRRPFSLGPPRPQTLDADIWI